MQKIKYIQYYNGRRVDDIESVSNNVAHGLIEKGVAILYKEQEYFNRILSSPENKMMGTTGRRKYKTK